MARLHRKRTTPGGAQSDVSTASELNRYVGVTEIALLGEEQGEGISDLAPTQWKGALNRSRQRQRGSIRDKMATNRHEVTADDVAAAPR
jgi:hypothetical protein